MIEQYLDRPDSFLVADAADPYRRLRILHDDDLAAWEAARRAVVAGIPGIIATHDAGGLAGFCVVRDNPGDTAALGVRIASLDVIGVRHGPPGDRAGRLDHLLDELRGAVGGSWELATALVDLDRVIIVDALERAGARTSGADHTWIRPLAPPKRRARRPTRKPGPQFRTTELLDAVADTYRTYRGHYHADPRLAGTGCASMYVEAVRGYLVGGGEPCVVRDEHGLVAFSTLEPDSALNDVLGRPAVAELGVAGVVPRARRQGVFRELLAQSLDRLGRVGFEHVVCRCAADNFGAQSALVADGRFRLRRFCVRLHWWLA